MIFSIDHIAQPRVSVVSIGKQAAIILNRQQNGHVLAVFERSFYVQFDDDVICIGDVSIGQGPIHVLLSHNNKVSQLQVKNGASIGIVAASYKHFDKTHTAIFSGEVIGLPAVPPVITCVSRALRLLEPSQKQGFSWLPSSTDLQHSELYPSDDIDNSFTRQTLPIVTSLYLWLETALHNSTADTPELSPQVAMLLGAGPGLTPSGDDLLAGVLLALHRLQRADLASIVWQALEPQLAHRTNIISGAHLRMTARGLCSESVLSLLACVLPVHVISENRSSQNAHAIARTVQSTANRIGASSGWDMLAGMSLVLRAM